MTAVFKVSSTFQMLAMKRKRKMTDRFVQQNSVDSALAMKRKRKMTDRFVQQNSVDSALAMKREEDDRQICAAEFSGFYTNLHNSVDNRVLQL